jgi:hypothetical protein
MSASAFSLSAAIPTAGFEVIRGEPVLGGLRNADLKHSFCPKCMSWMFTRPEGLDWMVNVRATMLDDHSWFVPFVELCTDEALPWAKTPARHSYGSYPEEQRFMEIAQEYATEGAGPA